MIIIWFHCQQRICHKLHNWTPEWLTHWGRDEMNTISQTTFSNIFSSMKMFELRSKFHWSLFPRAQITIFQHWFRQWLGAVQATSHYLNQWWLVYWRIYASLGLNELNDQTTGGRLNIKMSSYQYRNSHYKDKMVSWLPNTWKDSLTYTGFPLYR